MRILVLGGTQMIGRDFVERYSADHSIVIANRGVTGRDLFRHLEHVAIDREINAKVLEPARGGEGQGGPVGCRALGMLGPVDAVVDFSAYTVQHLENTMPFLPAFSRYVFISTTCVLGLADEVDQGDFFASYCFKKRECERWLKASGVLHSVLRPCIVVGANDYTGRFVARDGKYYWRQTGEEAWRGTVDVSEVSQAALELCTSEQREISLCR